MHRADPAYHATPFAHTRWDALATMMRTTPATVPRQRRTWALWASLAAHGVLVLGLVFSVAWKSSPPAALQAELWDAIPSTGAPAPPPEAEVPPQPAAAVKPEPLPAPEPEPEVIAPKTVKPAKVTPKAEPKIDLKPASKTDKAKEKTKEKAIEKAIDAERAKETARLNALLAPTGGVPTQGTPQTGHGAGLGASWGAKLQACVQPHMRFADASGGNPRVELTVQLLPSGTPIAVRISKPSGAPAFDAAVERAVMRCDPFPRPDSGGMPSSLSFGYSLKL